ncbi:MAG: sugar phosphorylase [Alkaliphilus sp.]
MGVLNILEERKASMRKKIVDIYEVEKADEILHEIELLMAKLKSEIEGKNTGNKWVNEEDIMMITYGDQIQDEDKSHLKSLHDFSNEYLKETISSLHILPFYPYSSDDGFSVIDYYKVNPELGEWADVEKLSKDYELMFDAVINHISAKSEWLKEYLAGNPKYDNFFVEADVNEDYSKVTRPRALPLLTKFSTPKGEKHVWTTFSEDQVDLNYANEKVLLEIMNLLLFYVSKGARLLRLDAIGYMWKRLGTTCIHLDEVHKIIQLMREVFEVVTPETILITETNVPHKDNISYFGNGQNEAQMVYQFTMPPLTLNAFHTGSAKHLTKWSQTIEPVSENACFFNFLASHDGIGVVPAKGYLTDVEIEKMAEKVKENGGFVSYKNNGDGTKSPYELNINYFDALFEKNDNLEMNIDRFIAAQSILLAFAGVPGIYVHSLLGSRNYLQGVKETGRNRSINREKINALNLAKEIADDSSLRSKVLSRYNCLIKKRIKQKAFHPNASQGVLNVNENIFSFVRTSIKGEESIICLVNVSRNEQEIIIDLEKNNIRFSEFNDIISDEEIKVNNNKIYAALKPYQVMWMKNK